MLSLLVSRIWLDLGEDGIGMRLKSEGFGLCSMHAQIGLEMKEDKVMPSRSVCSAREEHDIIAGDYSDKLKTGIMARPVRLRTAHCVVPLSLTSFRSGEIGRPSRARAVSNGFQPSRKVGFASHGANASHANREMAAATASLDAGT
ncbi:hypothetical protein CCMA1212_002086 [Trichoderma ghanense]|uniref:Uncharacterized protein n=1 Tax=Trichoderma ghanense TaxID=65468 RepID=A0ABY2HED6_9HYPO